MASVLFPFLAPWILHYRDKKPSTIENSVKKKKDEQVEKEDEQAESENEEEEVMDEMEETETIENTFKK